MCLLRVIQPNGFLLLFALLLPNRSIEWCMHRYPIATTCAPYFVKYIGFYNDCRSTFASNVITKTKAKRRSNSLYVGGQTVQMESVQKSKSKRDRFHAQKMVCFWCIIAFKIKSKMHINLVKSNSMRPWIRLSCLRPVHITILT